MQEMRQTANGRPPSFRQKAYDDRGETPTLSEIAPGSFNLNQIGALVLPLVSDGKRLIWVLSKQFDLQLDGAAELDKAFNRFPYLTESQTAALAQRCSLHPDQVQVWFAIQRLRYGISWDYKDILEVETKIKSSRGNEALQKDRGEKNNLKREVKESGGKKAGEALKEPSANEGSVMRENRRDDQQLGRKMKRERALKEEKGREVEELGEDKRHTQKKRTRMTATDKMGKIRRADEGVVMRAEGVELASDDIKRESTKFRPTQSETKPFTRKNRKAEANKSFPSVQEWSAHKSVVMHDEALDPCPLLTPLSPNRAFDVPPLTDSLTPNIHGTPVKSSMEENLEMEAKLEGESHAALTTPPKLRELKELTKRPRAVHARARIRCSTNTQTQLATMKKAFLRCQYPGREDYDRMVKLIGVSRNMLVQWFSDMRYYVKKVRPRWMNKEEHSQALANIRYKQCLVVLTK